MEKIVRVYGWKPDLPDHRDIRYEEFVVEAALPPIVDLRAQCPPVYDQGALGSCSGNAIAAAVDFERMKQGESFITPSRLFIYYNERVDENTIKSDSGAMIRDGMKSVNKPGVCKESNWPYVISRFTRKPTKKCYAEALNYQTLKYLRISRNISQWKACLASGYPVILGFSVYESFESETTAKTGVVTIPLSDEKALGGHAVVCVGYDTYRSCLIVRNSWGETWGDRGYFYLPFEYITNPDLSDDFWSIRLEK